MDQTVFTGLVEEQGTIADVKDESGGSKTIRVQCSEVHVDASMGASIAINGCCLTVVGMEGEFLDFQAGSETLKRTNLGELAVGSYVNLERALLSGARLGGHYVSGHIDGLGTVKKRVDESDWSYFWIGVDTELTRQMASKGSVAIDGVSLTLVDVTETEFSVALIPHTLEVTTLGQRREKDTVNIETDILAKYVQQQLSRQNS